VDVRSPDGTVIRALALSQRREDHPDRDYGLYFDPKWRPTWEADLVDWEDFGLPEDFEAATEQIRQAFLCARRGERVEIGCIGGLGPTGTALACMAVLAGVPADQAVTWVRANDNRHAVENPAQAQWVHWSAG
jgi:protein-tyrosine phosphatase